MTAASEGKTEISDSDEEKWEAFAPAVPKKIGWLPGFLTHEWTLAALGSVLLAVAMTWPTVKNLTTTIPQDIYDPLLQAWQIAWSGHALLTDPLNLWNANTFFPEPLSLAFSDSLLGYAPIGMLGAGPIAAIVHYNLIFVLLHALGFFGTYALTRQLGARIPGALVAGMAFAYTPWRLSQAGHMNVLSTGGMVLALAMLARGHGFRLTDGYRPDRTRLGWVLAGWGVAAWQITLGFGIGLPFGYALLVIGLISVIAWQLRGRPPIPRPILLANLAGGALFTLTTVLMALPYLQVAHLHPDAQRTEADLALFSPPLRGFLIAPVESWLWGKSHGTVRATLPFPAEMALLVGFVLIGLAIMGLAVSRWRLRTRLWLAATTVLVTYLALGTQAWAKGEYGYVFLFRHLPGLNAIRTPGRLVIWVTLLLAILAAGAVSAFCDHIDAVAHERPLAQPGIPLRLAMLVPVVLIAVESWNATPHPAVPPAPAALHHATGPMLVLPSDWMTDPAVMLWSTAGFPKTVNGTSGFTPKSQDEIRTRTASFPSTDSITYLRSIGVKTVIVLRDRIGGTPWQQATTTPTDGLGISRREVGNALVFTL